MAGAWLLVLGSNLDSDERMHAALAALLNVGPAIWASPIVKSPAHGGVPAPDYFNALVALESALDRAALVVNLKRIERELGRVHGSGRVAIDIDLLARRDGTRWLADPHAVEKNDLDRSPVSDLLRQAGIEVHTDAASGQD